MRSRKYSARICAAALAAAAAGSLWLMLPECIGPAAGAGAFFGGPVQAVHAAAALAAETPPPAAPESKEPVPAAAGAVRPSAAPSATAPAQTLPPAVGSGAADSYMLSEESAPPGAGKVVEKTYVQAVGGIYTACGAGTVRNNTSDSGAVIGEAIGAGLPFSVEVGGDTPQVLILHTHATETYRTHAGLWFAPEDTARSTDTAVNMCAVGRVMAQVLNDAGICTLHDETLNDYPSYTGSYANSRAVAQRYLAQYPSIKVILDVHRDAIETAGARVAPVCTVNGRQAAQVMLICGCNNGSSVVIPECRQNLRFAAAWEKQMEGMYPGLTRPVLYSYRFYNQDLSTGALLIEVGGHGSSLDEALYAGRLAAEGLAALFGA